MAIGNMHKKFGNNRACGSGDMLTDRQTHSSQYFEAALAGEVNVYCSFTMSYVQSYKFSCIFDQFIILTFSNVLGSCCRFMFLSQNARNN